MKNPDLTEQEGSTVAQKPIQEKNEFEEKWLRSAAELENARKRFEHERLNALKYGQESFIEELLPVLDNFYRAMEFIPATQQSSPWVAGIQYIQKNLLDTLTSRGLSEIPAKDGDAFDPLIHEAIKSEHSNEFPDNTVKVLNKGYRLHDKLVRPVQVAVYHQSENN